MTDFIAWLLSCQFVDHEQLTDRERAFRDGWSSAMRAAAHELEKRARREGQG